ncbi:NADH-quinone oxidoreductase subunit NuoN [Halotalea alkalilenta]|uniref:NADH-quinone oxidoreductase subunit N n=1 Tax=Halotalea alkalilenta TaxID=376489 RepID=A0A172YBW6_9GAMM|nr:NADH-quinone oxidoreductase subunit NuoN [Halotalea alkalilenta]ANF56740.1 NADH:ubiquinone oxidoreductase subunit N [Halotalea alkalilenta]
MNLTLTHLFAILPLIIVGITVVVVMLSAAWRRHHFLNATLTVIGLNLALASVVWVYFAGQGAVAPDLANSAVGFPSLVTPLVMIDGYALFYMALILVAALACSTLANAYLEGLDEHREEFYLLLLSSTMGAMLLVSSIHMASLFLGLELMSVALYGMAAYTFKRRVSLESGIKYMVLSAVASSFLLFGMALLYAAYGTLEFASLGLRLVFEDSVGIWTLIGVGMMVIGLGFKLSIVPFHMWTPDVYEGAPAPVSAFLATVSKVAVFAVLVRFMIMSPTFDTKLHTVIAVLAALSMIVGNLLALGQTNLKRLLGYSSIAHLGYLLSAVVALRAGVTDGGGELSLTGQLVLETSGIYLVTYVLTTLGAFGVVTLVSSPSRGQDVAQLHHFRGLFWRRPYLAVILTFMMLSLAGIPMTAGFIGKFYVLALNMNEELWWLAGAVVLGSAIGLYYYLRVMVSLYLAEPGEIQRDAAHDWGQRSGGVMVLIAALLTLLLGIYPQPLIDLVQAASPVGY